MSDHPPIPNLAAIRDLLQAAFTVEELPRFCQDDPLLRPIVTLFGPKHNLRDMVAEVITYCDTNLLFDHLLDRIRQENPRQYARFKARLKTTEVSPSPPPPAPSKRRLQTDQALDLGLRERLSCRVQVLGLIILTCLLTLMLVAIIAILRLIIPQERSTPTPIPVLHTTIIPSPTALPRKTPTPTVTATLTPTPTTTARPSSAPTPTVTATTKPSSTPTPTATATSKPSSTPTPTATATASPSSTPTATSQLDWSGQVDFTQANCGLTRVFGYTRANDGEPVGDIWVRYWTDDWPGDWAKSQWTDFGTGTSWKGDEGNWDGTIDVRPRDGVWHICVTAQDNSRDCISNVVDAVTSSNCETGVQVVHITFREN